MRINDILFNADLSDILYELKSQLTINHINLLSDMKDSPDNIMVTCPYHKGGQERKPSMGVKKSDGTCHCFTCGEVHTLPEMISHCFGYTDDMVGSVGWQWLTKNFLTVSVENRKEIKLNVNRSNNNMRSVVTTYVDEEELDSYRYIHPYMYKRKLTDEIIELFDIGYDKNTQCITFPIRDINGNTLFVARRSVKTKFFNYPQGVEKPVYGYYELQKLAHDKLKECAVKDLSRWQVDEIIICESMLDALTCWVYGRYAVALNGLGNELQFKQLNEMPCRKFILATDMDEAGQRARKRLKYKLKGKIVKEYIWDINVAKDINDMTPEYFSNLREIF